MKTCKYLFSTTKEDCKNEVNAPYDEEYCKFHAPKDKKGISIEEFNRLIFEKIKHEDFAFEGYIFPGNIHFDKVEFLMDAIFGAAQFSGEADFRGAQFSAGANFDKAQFSAEARFDDAQFSLGADFDKAY